MSTENQDENLSEDRIDVIFLGHLIGTASGWDGIGDEGDMVFYNFKSTKEVNCLPDGDLCVTAKEGFHYVDDEGVTTLKVPALLVFSQAKQIEEVSQ